MTTSETAARKKELTENFTIEELADMYLESEKQRTAERETAVAQVAELLAEIDEEKKKHEAIIAERDCCIRSGRSLVEQNETLVARLAKATRENRDLETALDVVIEKYARSKELVGVNED